MVEMAKYFLISIALFLTGCVSPKVIDRFCVSGIVIDSLSKLPVENVSIHVYQKASHGFNLNGKVVSDTVYSDKNGKFYIIFNKVTVFVGGGGPITGGLGKNPIISFKKDGYYTEHTRGIIGNDSNVTLILYRPNLHKISDFCKKNPRDKTCNVQYDSSIKSYRE